MEAWKKVIDGRRSRFRAFIYLSVLCLTLFSFLFFLDYNEQRKGYLFNDPVLNFIGPFELSLPIFLLTYLFSLLGLFITIRHPELFLKLMGAYSLMTILRMICLYLLPLEPPSGIIPLNDTFLNSTFYSGRLNLRDLFFSGHTATLFLFVFVLTDKKLKILFSAAAIVVAILLMMQHVHYTIDVVVAPIAAWMAFAIEKRLNKKFYNSHESDL